MEAEVFLLGKWKNYDELEEQLSLPELSATLEALREQQHNERRFAAGLQGIDLDAETGESDAEEIKQRGIRRAKLEKEGMSAEAITNAEFVEIGQAYHIEHT